MIRQMRPETLQRYLEECAVRPLLLDVREDWEFRHCRIEGSVNVPMAQIPERFPAFDSARETVLICHHGVRSQRAALYLESRGFPCLINLEGGIDAWARLIDPDMSRY